MNEPIEHHVRATLGGKASVSGLQTGKSHRIILERPVVLRPERPLALAADSGLVLPGPWMGERHPIPFLLSAVHESADLSSPLALLVGRVASGEDPALGQARADSLCCLVTGDLEGWVELATRTGSIRDVKGYLQYLNATLGWSCHIASVDEDTGADTAQAVAAFQKEYNTTFDRSILVDGICGEETLGALFCVLRHEWEKWLYKHDISQEQFDTMDIRFVDGGEIEPDWPGAEGRGQQSSLDLLIVDKGDLGEAEATVQLVYGSRIARFREYQVPLEPWAWERGPFTVVTDLIPGEVVPKETYTLRSTDGSFELSQSIPDDAIEHGLLQLRFFALPCDKAYDLTVTVHEQETYELFRDIPYNKLHKLATEEPDDG